MATETEIETVAEAIWSAGGDTPWEHASTGAVVSHRLRATTAIEALDRVRADDAQDAEPDTAKLERPRVSDITPAWMNYADSLEVELARVRASRDEAVARVADMKPWNDLLDGEEVCHRCGGPNQPWAAPSPLWNAVMRGGSINGHDEFDGIVCPTCFVVLAEERGIACGWWVEADTVTAELEMVTPSGRAWDPVARRWAEPGGTEPDTAKLVDALALLRGYVPMGGEGWNIINEALAGLSVDAVNSKSEAGGTT